MNRRKLNLDLLSLFIIIICCTSMLGVFDFIKPVNTINSISLSQTQSGWVVVERGADFVRRVKEGTNVYSWESAPRWVSDGSGWVPYIYSRDEVKKCYNVQVGFVGAKVYDTGVVELYDPELKEVRVKGETWELWGGTKKATLVAPITWGVVTNATGVYITRQQATSKPDGLLEIIYSFRVGSSLKHTVKWISTGASTVTVQVKQVHLMDFDRVITDSGVSTASKTEKSSIYLFGYGSEDFWVFEDQYAMVYNTTSLGSPLLTEKCLQSGEIDFAGKKVSYTFGYWTLATGQSLEVDPDTATLNNPTEDGFIYFYGSYTRYNSDNNFEISGYGGGPIRRGYVEWSTISIPDGATITNTVFKYHGSTHFQDCHIHAMAAKPSAATNANLYADIADGTVYADVAGFPVVGTNKEIDLGATADADLRGLLASDWFAIGIQSDTEYSDVVSQIFSEEYASATPKPTLYVEYTISVSITITSSPSGSGYVVVDSIAITTPHIYTWEVSSSHTIAANSPANLVNGQSQYIYTSWSDGGAQSHNYIVTADATVTASFQLQYYLTVTGGNSPTGQGWYNSGVNANPSNPWIWSATSNTRTALTNWSLDSSNQNPTRQNTGTFTTPNIAMSTYHTANFISTTQYYLTVTGGNGISYGTASPTSDNWYDSGTSTTVSSDWIWGTSGVTRTALTNWSLDSSNQNPTRQNTGTFTTPNIVMSTYHTANFISITQYYLTLLSTISNIPVNQTGSQTSDNWYDSGTDSTISATTPKTVGDIEFTFNHWYWTLGGVLQSNSTSNPFIITMTSYADIDGYWSAGGGTGTGGNSWGIIIFFGGVIVLGSCFVFMINRRK